jgi:hypothetical protein
MDWTSWGLVLVVALVAGAAGSYLYGRYPGLLRASAPYRCRLRHLRLGRSRPAPAALPPRPRPKDDTIVLMPDGRPCPLGPAVHILELAWRWQVVHGANLPMRARQGEGAYVWRPPLPHGSEQLGAEAER